MHDKRWSYFQFYGLKLSSLSHINRAHWSTVSLSCYSVKFIVVVQLPSCVHLFLTLEKAMVTHSSTLAWKIPWTEEPGGLQSMESLRLGHDWVTSLSLFTFMHWRRQWQPTPVFLPGESQGRGSLVGCHLWSCTESDTTEAAAASWPHELHHTRPPYPSQSPGACPSSCSLHRWCHPAISSSNALFSFCPKSFPGSGTFPMSHLFA